MILLLIIMLAIFSDEEPGKGLPSTAVDFHIIVLVLDICGHTITS